MTRTEPRSRDCLSSEAMLVSQWQREGQLVGISVKVRFKVEMETEIIAL